MNPTVPRSATNSSLQPSYGIISDIASTLIPDAWIPVLSSRGVKYQFRYVPWWRTRRILLATWEETLPKDQFTWSLILSTDNYKQNLFEKDSVGYTPMYAMARRLEEFKDVFLFLIDTDEGKQSLSIPLCEGDTPIHMMCYRFVAECLDVHEKVVSSIEGQRAALIQNSNGNTPLHLAQINYYKNPILADNLKVFLSTNLLQQALKLQNNLGKTPVHVVSERPPEDFYESGYPHLLESYLRCPAGVEALSLQDNEGNTPLHIAAQSVYTHGMKIIIESANTSQMFDIRNNLNYTFLDCLSAVAASTSPDDPIQILQQEMKELTIKRVKRINNWIILLLYATPDSTIHCLPAEIIHLVLEQLGPAGSVT